MEKIMSSIVEVTANQFANFLYDESEAEEMFEDNLEE
jgi:hypothetical protein